MNPRDELIRRAMMSARNGFAVGGKPGESAMARAEANRSTSSGTGNVGGIRDGGFGGAGAGRLEGSGNIAGNVGGIRDGGFGGANRAVNQPSASATYNGQNVNISPASYMLTPEQFDTMKRDLIQMQAASTDTGFRGTPGSQTVSGVAPKSFPSAPPAPSVDPATSVLNYNENVRVPDMVSMTEATRTPNPLLDPNRFNFANYGVMSGMQPDALAKLVAMQEDYGKTLGIGPHSGFRTPEVNEEIGGATNSQHLTGSAIDVTGALRTPADTAAIINAASKAGFGGLAAYNTPGLVHMDIGAPRVWGPNYSKSSVNSLNPLVRDALLAHAEKAQPASPAKTSVAASSFPSFDRLTTVPSYSAVGNVLMGETVNSPYNNITQSFYNALSPRTPSYGELENVAMGSTVGSPYNNIPKSAGAAPVVAGKGPQSITPSGFNAPQNTVPSPSYVAQGNFAPEYYSAPRQATPIAPSPSYVAQGNFAPEYYSAPYVAGVSPPVADVVANQTAVSPTADMPATMNYVPMVPRPSTPPPANANFFQSVANAMLPENLFPMAQYTQPTPPGQFLTLSPEDRGLFTGYMSEPFRIDRGIGVAMNPVTGIEDPNANVITTASGRQMAFNPASGRYEYVSDFRGSLDERPGGDNREDNRAYTQGRQNRKLLFLGYTQAEIDAMSPERIKEVLAGNIAKAGDVAKAANGGRIGYAEGGRGRNRGESSSSSRNNSAASTFYAGPDRLPDLPAFQQSVPPTYTMPQASPMISSFVNSMPQQASMPMVLPPVNPMQQRPQYSPQQGYFNPFENLFGYNQYLSNMGRPMNSGGSVNGSNNSISNAIRIARR